MIKMYICVFEDNKSLDFAPFLARDIKDAILKVDDIVIDNGIVTEAVFNGRGGDVMSEFTIEFKTVDGEIYVVDGWKMTNEEIDEVKNND